MPLQNIKCSLPSSCITFSFAKSSTISKSVFVTCIFENLKYAELSWRGFWNCWSFDCSSTSSWYSVYVSLAGKYYCHGTLPLQRFFLQQKRNRFSLAVDFLLQDRTNGSRRGVNRQTQPLAWNNMRQFSCMEQSWFNFVKCCLTHGCFN